MTATDLTEPSVQTSPTTAPPPKPSVADLIKSAAKKSAGSKPSSSYLWDQSPQLATETLFKSRIAKESKSEYDMARLQLIELVKPWYAKQVRLFGYQATVRFICCIRQDGTQDEGRLAFQHRFAKIAVGSESALREVVGEQFDTYFKRMSGLKIRKEVSEDPERLAQALTIMMEGKIAEHFSEFFESEEFLYPTRAWTERRWVEFSDEQNARCEQLGVSQIISFSDSTKD